MVMVRETTARVRRTDASAKIFTSYIVVGNPGLCQLVALRLAYDIFDTFAYPILMYLLSTHTLDTLLTILGLICDYRRNLYARRLNCISHIELEHTR